MKLKIAQGVAGLDLGSDGGCHGQGEAVLGDQAQVLLLLWCSWTVW